jgi:predicted permease
VWNELAAVVAPVLLIAGIGALWVRSGAVYPAEFIGRLVMTIGAPALIVHTLSRVSFDFQQLQQVIAVALCVLLVIGLLGYGLARYMDKKVASMLPPVLFSNSGNMGLPLCLFAFGEVGLALAMGFFLVTFCAHFTLGMLMMTHGRGRLSEQLREQLRQPVLYAFAVGLSVAVFEWTLPVWASNTLGLLAGMTIPLMLLTLGVSLASLKVSDWHSALAFSVLRVVGGFTCAWLACDLLGVDDSTVRGVILLQAMMPAAVFNYLLALRYDREPQAVASIVVLSTLLSLLLIPVFLSQYL